MKGTLYCVSVGPGDPELMTLKAVRIIRQCQVIALSADRRAAGLMEGKDTCGERMKCVERCRSWMKRRSCLCPCL